jgi:hypothetical protein
LDGQEEILSIFSANLGVCRRTEAIVDRAEFDWYIGRYQSQKRLEEAVIVQRIIEREQTKPEDYGQGLQQDM